MMGATGMPDRERIESLARSLRLCIESLEGLGDLPPWCHQAVSLRLARQVLREIAEAARMSQEASRPPEPSDKLLDALRVYGRHFETCPGSHPAYCTCGLTEALR